MESMSLGINRIDFSQVIDAWALKSLKIRALIDLPSLQHGLCENIIHHFHQLMQREGTLYLVDLPGLKLGLCENLLHQLMQLDEGEGIIPDRPP
jgi:hypothetical protein